MLTGFFDSGVGGLTVLYDCMRLMPADRYIYYSDSKNTPYGIKTHEEIMELSLKSADYLINCGINALVIACNTVTSIAIETIRQKYSIPVVGMEPALKPAVANGCGRHILVAATPVTLREGKFKSLIARLGADDKILTFPLPEMVGFAEKGTFDDEMICDFLEEKINFFGYNKNDIEAVVLGCTHFIFFRRQFHKVFNGAKIIDGNIGTVKRLYALTGHPENVIYDCNFPKISDKLDIKFVESGKEVKDAKRLRFFYQMINRMKNCEV